MPAYISPPSTLPPGAIVDVYLRDSGGEGQDRSVPSQLVEVQAYSRTHQLILRKIYKDSRTGKSIIGRDDFDRMIDEIQRGADLPNGVLLWDYARFARNAKDAVFHIALIENQGVIVHSLTDEVPDGEFRDLIRYVKHLGNEAERKKNSAAVKREMHQLVKTYGAMFGIHPRGIKNEPLPPILNPRTNEMRTLHKWVPDPEWIPRIQQAFAMKATNTPLIQIHKATHIYNDLASYRRFFSNKIYIGILEFGGEAIEDYCQPMIERKTWDAVQKVLALHADRQHVSSPSHHPRRRSQTATYLLSGIAHCGRCGSPLWGMSSGQRNGNYYLRYACTNAKRTRKCDLQPISAKALEGIVIQKLTLFFEDPRSLQALLEADRLQNADLASKNGAILKDLGARLKKLRLSITNITEAIAETGSKKSKSLLAKLASLEADETDLQSHIQSVKTQTPKTHRPLNLQEITFLSNRLIARLHCHDKLTVRSVLLGTINRLTVDRTGSYAYGTLKIHTPREPETPTDDPPGVIIHSTRAPITAPTFATPVGAHANEHAVRRVFLFPTVVPQGDAFESPIKKPT